MDTTVIVAFITIGGMALVAFITTYFNYLSKKLDHKLFVKQIRVKRTFDAYEALIHTIQEILITWWTQVDGKVYQYAHIFTSTKVFQDWYGRFEFRSYTWRYLLDSQSKEDCERLHNSLTILINQYPELKDRSKDSQMTPEELVKLSEEVIPLASKCYSSLVKYLTKTIEDL